MLERKYLFPRVSIIIVNWNGWRDTIECLESLYRLTYPNFDVIVVDNGSIDDSVEKIKEYSRGEIIVNSKFFDYDRNNKPIEVFELNEINDQFDIETYEKLSANKRLIIIKQQRNRGYAGGCNAGIKFALKHLKPKYILLLNNDTVVSEDFLVKLVRAAESHEKIGIVGPKIYYYDYGGRSDVISYTGQKIIPWKGTGPRYGDGEVDEGQWDRPMEVDKIEGSCMLIKTDVFKKIGLLDEKYFMYFEETDFCIRAKKAGFKLLYYPKAKIWHKVSASIGKENPVKLYLYAKNRTIFVRKNFPQYFWIHMIYVVFINMPRTAFYYTIYKKNPLAVWIYLRGFLQSIKQIRSNTL
ncbi:MAG: glycosyltransferase family 2 protein [Pyrobaculum sp.]